MIKEKGKRMVLINVEAERNPKRQFKKYQQTCELVKNTFESVVTTSLPGEERIFWPSQDVQLYIRDGDEKIHSTGNIEVIKQIFNAEKRSVSTIQEDGPEIAFWKNDKILFQLDDFWYVDEERLMDKDYKVDYQEIASKYQIYQTKDFENKELWYLLKFFFIGSCFQNFEGFSNLIGGVPKGLKVKCQCGNTLEEQCILKAFFTFREFDYEHQYYLRISERCQKCGYIICIYRDKALDQENYFLPLRIFLSFLDSSWKDDIEDLEMAIAWQKIFQEAILVDRERMESLYSEDIVKFGRFIQRI